MRGKTEGYEINRKDQINQTSLSRASSTGMVAKFDTYGCPQKYVGVETR